MKPEEKILSKIMDLRGSYATLTDHLSECESKHKNYVPWDDVDADSQFEALRTATLSFLEKVLGSNNIYHSKFGHGVEVYSKRHLTLASELLKQVYNDVHEGWLVSFKQLVSGEIFTDFLEMSDHLINGGYKDASAVIVGSVLERHLRAICDAHSISVTFKDNKGEVRSKRAESLNVDIHKMGIYNGTIQKSVTYWLSIRNSAAHGQYNEYDKQAVQNMHNGVADFVSKYI